MPVSSTAVTTLYAENLHHRASLRTDPLRLLTADLLAVTPRFRNVIA
jgi:hypothetical protein